MSNHAFDKFSHGKNLAPNAHEVQLVEEEVRKAIEPVFGTDIGPSNEAPYTMLINVQYPTKRDYTYPYVVYPRVIVEIYLAKPLVGKTERGGTARINKIRFDAALQHGDIEGNEAYCWECSLRFPESSEREYRKRYVGAAHTANCYEYGAAPSDWDFSKAMGYLSHIKEHPCKMKK